jgi:hypothetical protein
MRIRSALPRILRCTFGVLQVITVLSAALALVIVWFVPPGTETMYVHLVQAQFVPADGPVKLILESGQEHDISLLQGIIGFFPERMNGAVKSAVALQILLGCTFFLALCELLRRLFRNVERGDSFSSGSTRLVRGLGLLILLFTLSSPLIEVYASRRVHRYLGPSGTLMGREMRIVPSRKTGAFVSVTSHDSQFSLNFTNLLVGLVVLALSEVFRQGRQLQEENQLTI